MNIKKYYYYKFFYDLMPIYPIYVLLFESKSLSVTEISLLLGIWSVPLILLEIPTGILADRWSRKNMIMIGSLLKAACYFIWIFSEGFLLFALGFILWGISGCFHSGSEEALLYDSLQIDQREGLYDKILGRGRALSGISTVISAVSGGYIGMYLGMEYALYLSVLSGLIALGIAFTFKEVNFYKNSRSESEKEEGTLKEALTFLIKNRAVFIFTLMTLTVIGMAGILDEFDPLIAKNYGLTLNFVGIWVGIRFLFISFGSYIAYFLKRICQRLIGSKEIIYTISFLCILALVLLGISGLVGRFYIMGLYGLYFLIMSAGEVLQEEYIQQKIDSEGRSTVHSLVSLVYNLYGLILCGIIGIVLLYTSVHGMLVIISCYGLFLTLLFSFVHYKGSFKKE